MLHCRDGIGPVMSLVSSKHDAWHSRQRFQSLSHQTNFLSHGLRILQVQPAISRWATMCLLLRSGCTLPQICSSRQSCLGGLQTIPLASCLVCALTCTVNCGTLCRQVCAFPNHVQSTEFTTGGLHLSCRNTSRMMSGNRMPLSSILNFMAKAVNTCYCTCYFFVIVIFNKLAKISKLFSHCHYRVLCVEFWGKKINK